MILKKFKIFNYILNIEKKRIIKFIFYWCYTFLLIFTFICSNKISNNETFSLQHDDLTIVSAYYKIKSKRKPRQYKDWLRNFLIMNKSIVFFTNKKNIPLIKAMRPKQFYNKTVFIEKEIEEFYSYNHFKNQFEESFKIDSEKRYHTVYLYLVWAEKCYFLKKAIINNYFNSSCFYWIDAGYFRKSNEIHKYSSYWPSTKKCYEDPKILMGLVNDFDDSEKRKIINFDIEAHQRLQKYHNVIGGIFGGKKSNILKFIEYYYNTIRLFIKKKIFIGKDQNIFTFIAFSHPEIIKLIRCKNYFEYREHIS